MSIQSFFCQLRHHVNHRPVQCQANSDKTDTQSQPNQMESEDSIERSPVIKQGKYGAVGKKENLFPEASGAQMVRK